MTKSTYVDVMFKQADENYGWTKLFELFTPGSKVLDIGCSSGNFGKVLIEQKQCTVVGVDVNEDDLKIAAKKLTRVFKKDVEHDDLSDLGTFDFVLMADVIEHLLDPVTALKKIKMLLVPGGELVFSVPNMANIANRIELLGGRFKYTKFGLLDETHAHYYDRVEFEKVMNRAGFTVKKYNNTIRDLPATVVTAQLKKLGLSASKKFIKMTQDIDAITFQFIGVAKPVLAAQKLKTAGVESKTPYDFFSRQFDEVHRAHHEQANQAMALKSELLAQKEITKKVEQEKHNVQKRLSAIENSRGWRLLTKFYAAKKTLSGAFRRK